MTQIFEPAERKGVKALVQLAGTSGSGKTYSAILLARGLVGPSGRIAFIDTESGRGSHYADLAGGYSIAELHPPFTPQRYIEMIDAAEAADYDALIIDSISHEWEGEGGCVEQAENIELKSKNPGLHCWAKPKSQHKKLINRILRAKLHIIFCSRAREKTVQVKKNGRTEIVSAGIQPIVEKNFPFEMLLSATMDEASKTPILTKCPEELLPAFQEGSRISVETGRKVSEWLAGGLVVDEAFIDVANEGREAARNGTIGLRDWWSGLDGNAKKACKHLLDGELKSIAAASDEMAEDARGVTTTPIAKSRSATPKPLSKDPVFDTPATFSETLAEFIQRIAKMDDVSSLALHMGEFEKGETWGSFTDEEQASFRDALASRVKALSIAEQTGDDEDIPFENQAQEKAA